MSTLSGGILIMKCIITFLPALALVGSVPIESVTQSNYRNDLSGGARALMHLRQLGLSSDAQHNIANQTMLSADVVVMHATIETHLAALGVNQERRAWLLSHGRSG